MKKKIRKLSVLVALMIVLVNSIVVQAAGTINYGSESYTTEYGKEFQIGVYVSAEEEISKYYVYLQYNPEVLEFVEGAELVEEGLVLVSGNGKKDNYRQMLTFQPKLAGTTELSVSQVELYGKQGLDGEAPFIDTSEMPAAPITVETQEDCELSALTVSQGELAFNPKQGEYFLEVGQDVEKLDITASAKDAAAQVEISDTSLTVGDNHITIEVTKGNHSMQYLLNVSRMKPEADISEEPEEVTKPTAAPESVAAEKGKNEISAQIWILIIAIVIVLLLCIVFLRVQKIKRRRARRRRMQQRQQRLHETKKCAEVKEEIIELEEITGLEEKVEQVKSSKIPEPKESERIVLAEEKKAQKTEEAAEEPVISIQDVSMEFKLAQDESSSLKEFLIRTVKGKNTYHMFKALDHINLDIYKGEVMGIIGTNGSGKSTLLKIVSGALQPSKGKVVTDFHKVQLLTLGTGFDMELTARENVYLNGAIIGYTKEYIDSKFDEIVAFAELEGFMDERVKNFSTGMVSRLGFAIATMRDTPEILILDEVLSVGDMFFRKKSEKRIREMINSGSTVLIVSHSTGVITANCTKAVWIEKGIMRAAGDPKRVCAAYENMNQ